MYLSSITEALAVLKFICCMDKTSLEFEVINKSSNNNKMVAKNHDIKDVLLLKEKKIKK